MADPANDAEPTQAKNPQSVTPYLALRDAKAAIAFYERALGATRTMQLLMPDGKIAHAEIRIGDSVLMMSEENPDWGNRSPHLLGGSAVHLTVHVPDVDAAFAKALAAGGEAVRPVADQFYGERAGTFKDPFGYQWTLSTHIETVSEAECQRRMDKLFGSN